jgi:hypothetical protein
MPLKFEGLGRHVTQHLLQVKVHGIRRAWGSSAVTHDDATAAIYGTNDLKCKAQGFVGVNGVNTVNMGSVNVKIDETSCCTFPCKSPA